MQQDLDAARERAPKPGWLRDYAGAMRFEAMMLASHQEDALRAIVAEAGPDVDAAVNRAMLMSQAEGLLTVTADTLAKLADALET